MKFIKRVRQPIRKILNCQALNSEGFTENSDSEEKLLSNSHVLAHFKPKKRQILHVSCFFLKKHVSEKKVQRVRFRVFTFLNIRF